MFHFIKKWLSFREYANFFKKCLCTSLAMLLTITQLLELKCQNKQSPAVSSSIFKRWVTKVLCFTHHSTFDLYATYNIKNVYINKYIIKSYFRKSLAELWSYVIPLSTFMNIIKFILFFCPRCCIICNSRFLNSSGSFPVQLLMQEFLKHSALP